MTTTAAIPSAGASAFRLTVLNPGGRDARRDFPDGAGSPDDEGHAPVNFHGYAACTRGVFHCETKAALAEKLPVLLLLRGDSRAARAALRQLRDAGLTTAISLKETGLHQIARQLGEPKRAELFRTLIQEADGYLAATPEAVTFGGGEFIPTPYPIGDPRWDFSRVRAERRGVFIGTREWRVPSRNHFAAFQIAARLRVPVTVFDENPRRAQKLWSSLGGRAGDLICIERRLPYRAYLALIARHQLLLQADRSAVPGQVAGDALLCRIPCVGGDGAVERHAFRETCGFGRSLGELAEIAARLLRDDKYSAEIENASQAEAHRRLGFAAVARELERFFESRAPSS